MSTPPISSSPVPTPNATTPNADSPRQEARSSVALVPLMDPKRVYADWGRTAEQRLIEILRSHAFVKGRYVAAFEEAFAEHLGVAHAVAVDSGTDALWLALRVALDGRPPEARDVLIPTFTFVATAGAVVNAGGRPVFVDVDGDTANLSHESVLAHLSRDTAAIVPVHLFGNPVDVVALRAAAEQRLVELGRDLEADPFFVIEDAAQSVHARIHGRATGALGDAGCFSFYPSKNLGAAGDGGIVTTPREDVAQQIRALRDHGQTRKLYDHDLVGTNSRMDEMQAAVLDAKLPFLAAWTEARRRVAARYLEAFADLELGLPRVLAGAEPAWHLFTIRSAARNALREALTQQGIGTGVYYPLPLHRQACFNAAGAPAVRCPVADRLSGDVLSLPCFPGLTEAEQDRVIEAVRGAH